MTMEELKAQMTGLSDEFLAEYGPILLKMSTAEALSIIDLITSGKELEAWAIVVAAKTGPDALAEAQAITTAWNEANAANADSIALQKKAVTALLGGVLSITLAMVGL